MLNSRVLPVRMITTVKSFTTGFFKYECKQIKQLHIYIKNTV